MPSSVLSNDISWISISAVSAILLAVIPLLKYLSTLYFEKHKINLKKLEIAASVLSDNLDSPTFKQRYLAEQVFRNIHGFRFSYHEIKVLLKYHEPSLAFDLYVKGYRYLAWSKNFKHIQMKGQYRSLSVFGFKLYLADIRFIIGYFSLGFACVYATLLSISTIVLMNGGETFNSLFFAAVYAFTSIISGIMAFHFIASVGSIKYAYQLLDMKVKSLK
ncbi:hypothetical protein [Shewanella colwelliana]|uniref:hypothetical protein n=1 Tax=Shewanella colwelliana TaxID=23 RepID=UPI0037357BDA